MARINFDSLPKEAMERVEPGIKTLTIKNARVETSTNGFEMLVLENSLEETTVFAIRDNFSLFDTNDKPVQFGQYKLRCLLQATNTIPTGDFTTEIIAKMLVGKKYQAEVVYETYQEKDYLRIGRPETFAPMPTAPQPKTTMPTAPQPKTTIDKPFPPDDNDTELNDDDEI